MKVDGIMILLEKKNQLTIKIKITIMTMTELMMI